MECKDKKNIRNIAFLIAIIKTFLMINKRNGQTIAVQAQYNAFVQAVQMHCTTSTKPLYW